MEVMHFIMSFIFYFLFFRWWEVVVYIFIGRGGRWWFVCVAALTTMTNLLAMDEGLGLALAVIFFGGGVELLTGGKFYAL